MRKWTALSLALLFSAGSFSLFSTPSHAAQPPEQRLYKKAADKLARLSKDRKKRRLRSNWERVISDFDRITGKYPRSQYAGDAMYSKGEAYEGMHKVSLAEPDLRDAAATFEDLAGRYPRHARADDALQKAAAIYMELGEEENAAMCYGLLAGNYSKSPHAKEARARLKTLPKARQDKPYPGPGIPAAAPAVPVRDAEPALPYSARKPGLACVNEIRHWSNTGYTRVVIDLDGYITYEAHRLKEPDRLFFDIKKAAIAGPFKDGTIAINDGILKTVRASQFDQETVRVVLDLESITDYRTLMLSDPTRLVVDVTGKETLERRRKGRIITLVRDRLEGASFSNTTASTAGRGETMPSAQPAQQASARPPETVTTSDVPAGTSPPAAPGAPALTVTPAPQPAQTMACIVLDPGHGGHDSGAVGRDGLQEKDVVLDIGLRLREVILREFGCRVVMTRDRDAFVDLDARPGVAVQQDADLFISIHANASKNKKATGIETYLLNLTKDRDIMEVAARENMTSLANMGDLEIILKDLILDTKREDSLRLAHSVQSGLVGGLKKHNGGVNDKGVKQGPFLVLYGASMPSVLTEVGFISNPEEEKLLASPAYRKKVAEAIFEGIREYVSSQKVVTNAARSD